MTYKPFDVVVVPFPFSDSAKSKKRPALVLSSSKKFKTRHSVCAMITSARNEPWPLDVFIEDFDEAGLPKISVVRMKFFTLDNDLIIKRLGSLTRRDRVAVSKNFEDLFVELLLDLMRNKHTLVST